MITRIATAIAIAIAIAIAATVGLTPMVVAAPAAQATPVPPRVPALVDDGDCGTWWSPAIGSVGVFVGQAVHRAMCDAVKQRQQAGAPDAGHGVPETPPG